MSSNTLDTTEKGRHPANQHRNPKTPLRIGDIVTNLKDPVVDFTVLNAEAPVPIPTDNIRITIQEDFYPKLRNPKEAKVLHFARIRGLEIQNINDIPKSELQILETQVLTLPKGYLDNSMNLEPVRVWRENNDECSLRLITGLKTIREPASIASIAESIKVNEEEFGEIDSVPDQVKTGNQGQCVAEYELEHVDSSDRLLAYRFSTIRQKRKSHALLEKVLAHTRTSRDTALTPLYAKNGLRILGLYAFGDRDPAQKVVALRCLNNILVRSVSTRQVFINEGYPSKVLSSMKNGEPNEELATANLFLFCASQPTFDLTSSFEDEGLAEIVNKNIARHAQSSEPLPNDPANPALASLRLLSTLAVRAESQAHRFLPSLEPILDLLSKVPATVSHADLPASVLISCLVSIPIDQSDEFPVSAVDKLANLLQEAIPKADGSSKAADKELLPLLLVLHRLAQSKPSDARKRLAEHILPSDEDRTEALGKGESLPHRLLKLTSTTVEPELREMIVNLFFEISDKDPNKFVHHVGFGHAAGLLSSKGIQFSPEGLAQAQASSSAPDINPITGQQRSAETASDLPEMTEEEKEREAERLFVLFERLRANGLISVENPVTQYKDSGRFEELPDDASD
ncbi:hypothetical protein BHE90_010738 [Fusarium euwallaceae]|uniref:Uncharacterized protein n=1 Tax=Fusarium euwallaceae TaxID=1147111 RepID=A0A430LGG9_9HYPO|nr:hypothetical protein BHE90_010738 [Fusarium euwallaceae]